VANTIRDILIRITGDGTDAKRELATLARDLQAFGKINAEAEAEVDTASANAQLALLEEQLDRIDNRHASAQTRVEIGRAMAELVALRAELERIDGMDVDVDVDVRRGVLERIGALGRRADGLVDSLARADDAGRAATKMFNKAGISLGFMTLRAGAFAKVLPVLVTALGGLLAALSALTASAAFAVGGLVLLTNAFLFSLLPAIGLGVAAFLRFKDTMDQAGTPANKIKKWFEDLTPLFSKLKKAADPVLHAVANNLDGIERIIRKLVPAFQDFGKQAGKAVSWLMRALDQPAVANAIADLVRLAGPVMKPLVQIFYRFFRIALNLARAAMPALTSILGDLAGALGGITKSTGDMGRMRGIVGTLVSHTRAWLDLIGSVVGLFTDLFVVIAPYGKALVESLTEGANQLREWIRSEDGTRRIKEWFEDMLPFASELAKFLGKLFVIGLQIAQILAPAFTLVLRVLNPILDVVIWLLDKLQDLLNASQGEWFGGMKKVLTWLPGLTGVFGDLARKVADAWDWIKEKTSSTWNFVRSIPGRAVDFIKKRVSDQVAAVRRDVANAWNFVREKTVGVWTSVRDFIVRIWTSVRDRIASIANGIRDKIGNVFSSIRDLAGRAWGTIRDSVTRAFGSARDGVVRIADAIWSKISSVFGRVASTVRDRIGDAAAAVGNSVSRFAAAAQNIGEAIVNGVVNIVSQLPGKLAEIATDAVNRLKDIINTVIAAWNNISFRVPSININPPGPGPEINFGGFDVGTPNIDELARGVIDFKGGVAMVGEEGRELVELPRGANVFPSALTEAILNGLGGERTFNITVPTPPSGGPPEPETLAAQLAMALRARGEVL
jgi:hypothetical protein